MESGFGRQLYLCKTELLQILKVKFFSVGYGDFHRMSSLNRVLLHSIAAPRANPSNPAVVSYLQKVVTFLNLRVNSSGMWSSGMCETLNTDRLSLM